MIGERNRGRDNDRTPVQGMAGTRRWAQRSKTRVLVMVKVVASLQRRAATGEVNLFPTPLSLEISEVLTSRSSYLLLYRENMAIRRSHSDLYRTTKY